MNTIFLLGDLQPIIKDFKYIKNANSKILYKGCEYLIVSLDVSNITGGYKQKVRAVKVRTRRDYMNETKEIKNDLL